MQKKKEKTISAAAVLNIKSLKANDLYGAQKGKEEQILECG